MTPKPLYSAMCIDNLRDALLALRNNDVAECRFIINYVITTLKESVKMDKQIKKVEKDVKKNKPSKALKDIKDLKKMDKKFDKKIEKADAKMKGKC